MKKKLFIMILLWGMLAGPLAAQDDAGAFEKAKLLIFDKQWAAALAQLDEVIARYPDGRHFATALFYRGKCQEELGARKQALESYERFIRNSAGSNLAEEARISILDLAAALHQAGEKGHLQKILAMLNDKNKVVAYYAAFKLSYLPERRDALQALPVLLAILEKEKDAELRDRARIAVMRLDPARLKGEAERGKGSGGKMLRIRVLKGRDRQAAVSLNIPLALADLAIQSLSSEQKRALQKKGYDLDQVLARLTGQGLKIEIQEEDSVFQIWVE
ncbi:MAG: tetratricopeptide repeat protein [Acidobacteria bacterium]|jgi:tetratricopeptide (TPR) repeat protein|nr:tetratricopeptide repeat protein [Acidobacteriota bacterium]